MGAAEFRDPLATYRVQLGTHMPFGQLIGLLPYLGELGISHLYLSPCFQAAAGSTHGYDVVDPAAVNPELGGLQAFEHLCRAADASGIGLVLDIVPNHMAAAGRQNRWWWDLLARGRHSRWADFFDVRWDHPDPSVRGKVLLPVLGDEIERCLERGQIQLRRRGEEIVLCYFENEFPVSARSLEELRRIAAADEPAALDAVIWAVNADTPRLVAILDLQHYRLAFWRRANREINYRRFFDIHQLAAVCVEKEEVFLAMHARVLEWVHAGQVDGLRIDHPDGLRDPTAYLKRLHRAAPCAWVVVEKILEPGEALAADWPVAGTTGYDFLNMVNGLFVDPRSARRLAEFYAEFTGQTADFPQVVREKKRLVVNRLFESELSHLVGLMQDSLTRQSPPAVIRPGDVGSALTEIIACFPVYRTYIRPETGRVAARDRAVVREAFSAARQQRPDIAPDAWGLIEARLLLNPSGSTESEFIRRFQQLTGPVMAKGVEDTAFYCFNRLISLNEVGGNPGQFGTSPEAFHAFCRRIQTDWPRTMLASATHDTKRGEDTRVRIGLLSEIPERWISAVRRWSRMNASFRRDGFPDPNTEYFLYQTLVGAWPIGRDRLVPAMLKAVKEAKVHTSWIDSNVVFEDALRAFVEGVLGNRGFTADLSEFLKPLARPAVVTSLSQSLIKATAPGVPDIYQGTELWDHSLVDPDNRRPVDYELRRRLLAETGTLSVEEIMSRQAEGLPKLFLIQRVLATRRRFPEVFGREGGYQPLAARGGRSDQLVAFMRGKAAVTLAPRLAVGLNGDWETTTIELPSGRWEDVFSAERFSGGTHRVGQVLARFPVGLLTRR